MNIGRRIGSFMRSVSPALALGIGCALYGEVDTHDLSINDAVKHALASDPAIHGYRLMAEAEGKLREAAKRLPEPSVRTGLMNVPVDGFALDSEPMTQAIVGVRQTIPAVGSRSATSMAHEHRAHAFRHQTALQAKETALATRNAWLEAHYQRDAVDLTSQALQLLENLSNVVRARYAAGDELQVAVLAAELESSDLASRLIDTKRRESQSLDELGRLLGVVQGVSIKLELPIWDVVPSPKSVYEAIEIHPKIRSADAFVAMESAQTDFYQSELKPEWHIDLSYGIRDGANFDGGRRSDFASAIVSFSLPLVAKEKHSLRLLAAQASEDSARQTKAKLLRDLTSEIAIAYSEWHRLSERLQLLNETIVEQSHNHAQAALKAYQNKEGSFADVLLSYVNEVDAKLEQHRVRIDRLKAWATIDSLNGSTK